MALRRLAIAVCVAGLALAACKDEVKGPTPSGLALAPGAACNDQLITVETLTGSGLSPVPADTSTDTPRLVLPQLTLVQTKDLTGAGAASSTKLSDDPSGNHVRWSSQSKMAFDVFPGLKLVPGVYDVQAKNADGQQATAASALLVVPPPTATKLTPDLACGDEDNTLTLEGDFFIQLGDSKPKVVISGGALNGPLERPATPSDCRDLPRGSTEKACKKVTFTVAHGTLAPAAYQVRVTNPDPVACTSTNPLPLVVVPEPVLTKIEPDLACDAEGDQTITLTGTDFLKIDSADPSVTIGAQVLPGSASSCTPLSVPTGIREVVQRCTTVTTIIPRNGISPGSYLVTVTNPAPVGCSTTARLNLTIAAPPTVTGVSTDLTCTADGAVSLTVTGTGFLGVGTASPTVTLQSSGGTSSSPLPATLVASSCTAVAGVTNEQAQSCTQLTVSVPATVAAGSYTVVVTNPSPAGCSSTDPVHETLVPGPTVASLAPSAACNSSSSTHVTATGANFLQVGSALPTVSVGSRTVTASAVSGCTAVATVTEVVQSCTSLEFDLAQADATALGLGDEPVVVHNPAPAACSSATPTCPAAQCLSVIAPPQVTLLAPAQLCAAGATMTLTGVGLRDGTLTFTPSSGAPIQAPVTVVGGTNFTQATAQVGALDPGTYQVTYLVAGGTCGAQAAGGAAWTQAITVVPGPQLFFANPRVVYSGITTEVTFYGASITGTVTSLQLRDSNNNLTPLTGINYSNNVVRALVPKNLPAGTYSVVLTDNTACQAELNGGLVVTDVVKRELASMTPPFGKKDVATAVTITATAHGVFQPLPQAYLNPVNATGSTVATAIRGLAINEPTDVTKPDALTGVVAPVDASTPLTVGAYNLIVVNPDGTVELLDNAFTVTNLAPPRIDNVSPGSFPAGGATIAITGANFATSGATVSLSCKSVTTGAATNVSGTVTGTPTATSISATVNVVAGEVCVVRVTNPDSTYAEFSSVVTTTSSGNLSGFTPGSDLGTPRAALQAAAGNATSAARFLYAIGGNDGTSVLASVEAAPVDLFGVPSTFKPQRYSLTEGSLDAGTAVPREMGTAVTVGRFIYLVGGTSDGTTPLTSLDRAEILSLDDAPQVNSLGLGVDADGGGLDPGVWYYRVSAVMPDADPTNPGGETLAGDAFGLQLCDPNNSSSPTYCPNLAGKKLDVSLSWTQVPGAVAYLVYRTTAPNQTPDQTQLLARVDAATVPLAFGDNASAAPAAQTPLDVGALGRWSTVATLATGRIAPAVTSAAEPGDPSTVYLYAFGGRTGTSTVASDYEIVPLALGVDGFGRPTQTPGAVVTGAAPLQKKQGGSTVTSGLWLNQAYTGTNETASVIPAGETWVYVGPGAFDTGATSNSSIFNYGELVAGKGGKLTTGSGASRTEVFGTFATNLNNLGYGGTLQADYFNYFGGATSLAGSPSTSFTADQLLTSTTIQSRGSNGTSFTTPRMLMGTAVQSGTIFVLGGWTAGNLSSPTAKTDYTYW